jgi:hypothetical protein
MIDHGFAIALAIGYTAYTSFQRADFLHSTTKTNSSNVYILAFKELIFYTVQLKHLILSWLTKHGLMGLM